MAKKGSLILIYICICLIVKVNIYAFSELERA